MKNLIVALFVFSWAFASFAGSWSPTLACSNNVLDMSEKNSGGPYYQLVVRDPAVINYFSIQGAVTRSEVNDKNELIFSLAYNGNNEYSTTRGGIKYFVWTSGTVMFFEARDQYGMRLADWVFRDCQFFDRGYRHGDCGLPQPYVVIMSGRPGPWFYSNESCSTNPGRFYPRFNESWQVQYNSRNQVVGCYDNGCCQ